MNNLLQTVWSEVRHCSILCLTQCLLHCPWLLEGGIQVASIVCSSILATPITHTKIATHTITLTFSALHRQPLWEILPYTIKESIVVAAETLK